MASMNYKGQPGSGVGGKMKSGGAVKASIRHDDKDERLKAEYHSNEYIDKTLTPDNVDFMGLSYKEKCERFDARIKELDETTNTNKRKDRVLAFGLHTTIPDTLPIEQQIEFARDIVDLYADIYGRDNIIAADFHQDEGHDYVDSRTHNVVHSLNGLHITIVPEIDGQLNAKEFSSRGSMKIMNKEIDKIAREKYGIEYLKHEEHEKGEYKSVEEMQQMSDEFCAERKQELNDIKQDIEQATQELDDTKQELTQTQGALKDTTQELTQTQNALKDTSKELEQAQGALKDVRNVEQFASDVENKQIGKSIPLNGGVVISKEDVPALQKMAGIVAKLENTISSIKTQTDALDARQNNIERREQKLNNARDELNTLKTHLNARKADLDKLGQNLSLEVVNAVKGALNDFKDYLDGKDLTDENGHVFTWEADKADYLEKKYQGFDIVDDIVDIRYKALNTDIAAREEDICRDIGREFVNLPQDTLEAVRDALNKSSEDIMQWSDNVRELRDIENENTIHRGGGRGGR